MLPSSFPTDNDSFPVMAVVPLMESTDPWILPRRVFFKLKVKAAPIPEDIGWLDTSDTRTTGKLILSPVSLATFIRCAPIPPIEP